MAPLPVGVFSIEFVATRLAWVSSIIPGKTKTAESLVLHTILRHDAVFFSIFLYTKPKIFQQPDHATCSKSRLFVFTLVQPLEKVTWSNFNVGFINIDPGNPLLMRGILYKVGKY